MQNLEQRTQLDAQITLLEAPLRQYARETYASQFDEQAIEDLVQEVFIHLLEDAHAVSPNFNLEYLKFKLQEAVGAKMTLAQKDLVMTETLADTLDPEAQNPEVLLQRELTFYQMQTAREFASWLMDSGIRSYDHLFDDLLAKLVLEWHFKGGWDRNYESQRSKQNMRIWRLTLLNAIVEDERLAALLKRESDEKGFPPSGIRTIIKSYNAKVADAIERFERFADKDYQFVPAVGSDLNQLDNWRELHDEKLGDSEKALYLRRITNTVNNFLDQNKARHLNIDKKKMKIPAEEVDQYALGPYDYGSLCVLGSDGYYRRLSIDRHLRHVLGERLANKVYGDPESDIYDFPPNRIRRSDLMDLDIAPQAVRKVGNSFSTPMYDGVRYLLPKEMVTEDSRCLRITPELILISNDRHSQPMAWGLKALSSEEKASMLAAKHDKIRQRGREPGAGDNGLTVAGSLTQEKVFPIPDQWRLVRSYVLNRFRRAIDQGEDLILEKAIMLSLMNQIGNNEISK